MNFSKSMLLMATTFISTLLFASTIQVEYVSTYSSNDLENVTEVKRTPNGKLLFAASYIANTLSVFNIEDSGKLKLIHTYNDPIAMSGAIRMSISPDGRWLVLAQIAVLGKVSIYQILDDGRLILSDFYQGEENGQTLARLLTVRFSPDGRFVAAMGSFGLVVFSVEDGFLEMIQEFKREDNDYLLRTLDATYVNNGKQVLVIDERTNSLIVYDRDRDTGLLTLNKIYKDDSLDAKDQPIKGIDGVYDIFASPDGKYVYTTSGRGNRNTTISGFEVGENGELTLLNHFTAEELDGFDGGHRITVSPDGKTVYSVAFYSNSMIWLDRSVETGKITFGGQIAQSIEGASAIDVSPDSQFVFVGAESGKKVTTFRASKK